MRDMTSTLTITMRCQSRSEIWESKDRGGKPLRRDRPKSSQSLLSGLVISVQRWARANKVAVPVDVIDAIDRRPIFIDAEGAWRELLRAAADGGAFELWSESEHELLLRDRLLKAAPAPRVVWLPLGAEEIGYLKVFELHAEVWTERLVPALARFGVEIARDHEAGLRDMLRAYAVERIDQPRASWRDLTPGSAKSALVDEDQRIVRYIFE